MIRPLLIFWEALGPSEKTDEHLFRVCVKDNPGDFSELWVFSVSSYLRSSGKDKLTLEMPVAAHRLGVLAHLFSA